MEKKNNQWDRTIFHIHPQSDISGRYFPHFSDGKVKGF